VLDLGFFSGNTTEIEIFCGLWEDTFDTYLNGKLPEFTKVNFVKSKIRNLIEIDNHLNIKII